MYEAVIGLEVHFELATKTKLFCSCENVFGADPNTCCCPTCLGLPGALPVLNRRAVEYALMAGLALDCDINNTVCFDRKNYFYPDMPNGYQISQFYSPICTDGKLSFAVGNDTKTVKIREIHLEDDAGKLIHSDGATLVDYNRAGVPLIEVVTHPDLTSAEETVAFLEALHLTMQYLGVSDCKMQEGSMRVDVNLSVHKKGEPLGTRTEMKNLNSFKAVAHAVQCEKKRQIALIESGHTVVQETRRFDDLTGISTAMRSKEETVDYRYFPEPNLPAIKLSDRLIETVKSSLPELVYAKCNRYANEYGLSDADIKVLTSDRFTASFFEQTVSLCGDAKEAANRVVCDCLREVNDNRTELKNSCLTPQKLSRIIILCKEGVISRKISREIISAAFKENIDIDAYIEKNCLSQITDISVITEAAKTVLTENPKAVADWRSGKRKVFGNIVGMTMKKLGGRGAPEIINNVVESLLN